MRSSHAVPNFETGVYISASSGNQIISNLSSANGVTGVEIFGQVVLSNLKAWKLVYADEPPPLQVMSDAENERWKLIVADKSPGKSGYQYGGEPTAEVEVLQSKLLCFHDPRVVELCKKQIDEILAFPGVGGVAFDFFGYQNYHCCYCPASLAQLAKFRELHPELSPQQAEQRFSLETLVDFNNQLSAHAHAQRPTCKVITHVYPVFLPEPLYGNRLNVDVCAQTAAWFFEPFWSLEKIRNYSRIISKDANRYFPRPIGAALIGYEKYPVKSPERIREELQAIIDGGCTHVHACDSQRVINNPDVAAVFQSYFGKAK